MCMRFAALVLIVTVGAFAGSEEDFSHYMAQGHQFQMESKLGDAAAAFEDGLRAAVQFDTTGLKVAQAANNLGTVRYRQGFY